MFSAQPLALFSVFAPSMVVCRIPSNDVQVGLLRVVHPPDDDQVIPAARNWLSAEAWVTADAGRAAPSSAVSVRTTDATIVRRRGNGVRVVMSEFIMSRTLGPRPSGENPHDRALHEHEPSLS